MTGAEEVREHFETGLNIAVVNDVDPDEVDVILTEMRERVDRLRAMRGEDR